MTNIKNIKEKKSKEKKISVTQIASGAGKRYDQVQTLKGLGLGKMHRTRLLEDTPSVWGMIKKVNHMVVVKTEI